MELLDPGAVVRADAAAVAVGADPVASGIEEVARTFSGRAQTARLAEIDGYAGLVWSMQGHLKVAFGFVLTEEGKVGEIELIADPAVLATLDVTPSATLRRFPANGSAHGSAGLFPRDPPYH